VHDRGHWDLSRHEKFSGVDLKYLDPETKEKYTPQIIETSDGVGRAMLAFLINAYEEVAARSGDDHAKHEKEVVLRLDKRLAPIKVAILPLSKKTDLEAMARDIQKALAPDYMTQYDATASIGKRYRRQDEIGTPYCITVDFDSLVDKQVTVRDRDTMKQNRIAIGDIKAYLAEQYSNV